MRDSLPAEEQGLRIISYEYLPEIMALVTEL
jgi:hypothetical protein